MRGVQRGPARHVRPAPGRARQLPLGQRARGPPGRPGGAGPVSSHAEQRYTRRQFLIYHAIMDGGADYFTAAEAVASTALEHPEWDMDETHTWREWQNSPPPG